MKKIYNYLKENKVIAKLLIICIIFIISLQILKIFMEKQLEYKEIEIMKDYLILKIDKNKSNGLINSDNKSTLLLADIIVIVLIMRFVTQQKERIGKSTYIIIGMLLIGATSNMIDKIFRGNTLNYINIPKVGLSFNIETIIIILAYILFAFVTAKATNDTIKEVKDINEKKKNKKLEKDVK